MMMAEHTPSGFEQKESISLFFFFPFIEASWFQVHSVRHQK